MDIFGIFSLHLVIQLISKVHADELVSSLLGSTSGIRCASPFLSFNTEGYIQCQRTCVNYSRCNVLRYSKSHLECFLYINKNCWNYSGDPDSSIYIRRNEINESIGSSCHTHGCPTANVCVMVKGVAKCVPDKVPSPYAGNRATFIDVDGVYFWMYPDFKSYAASKQICESKHGRLAILDTQRKMQVVQAEANNHSSKWLWIVGAKLSDSGQWLWSNGASASGVRLSHDGYCCVLSYGLLHDYSCDYLRPFICETI